MDKRTSELMELNAALNKEIEKLKVAQEALRESEERYRDIERTISDIIWEVDIAGNYTYISRNVQEILGYKSEYLLGKPFYFLMPPDEQNRLITMFLEYFDASRPEVALEATFMHKDGHHVILENRSKAFYDSVGRLAGYRGVDRDVTVIRETKKEKDSYFRFLEKGKGREKGTCELLFSFLRLKFGFLT